MRSDASVGSENATLLSAANSIHLRRIIDLSAMRNCRMFSQVLKNFPETLQADTCLYLNDKLLSECSAFRSASPGQQLKVEVMFIIMYDTKTSGNFNVKRTEITHTQLLVTLPHQFYLLLLRDANATYKHRA